MLNYRSMETGQHSAFSYGVQLQRGPAADILRLLQRNGPMSVKQLREALGVSSLNAVREPLAHLAAAGLVQSSARRGGAGRPYYIYALSARAQDLFPKGYDVLLTLLLEELEAREGREQLQAILEGVSARLAAQVGGAEDGQALADRLLTIQQAFDERGVPITLLEADDTVTLHNYTCPYFEVAQKRGEVCSMEQGMLERVLGRKVRLTRRLVDGHAGCEFVIDGRAEAPDENDNC